MRRECQAQFLQDEITTLYVALQHHATLQPQREPHLAWSGIEWSSNAKCTKHIHGTNTNESILVLFDKNAITTYLKTCLLSAYTLLCTYFLPLRVIGTCA